MKVKITQTFILEMDQESLDMLREACFEDGDRQMLHETLDSASEELTIEEIPDAQH